MKRTNMILSLLFALALLLVPQSALAADGDTAEGTRDVVVNTTLKTQSELAVFSQLGYPDVLPEFDRYDYWTIITLTSLDDPSVTFEQRIDWGPDTLSKRVVFPDVPYGQYAFSYKHESTDPNGAYKDNFGFEYVGRNHYYGWISSRSKVDVMPEGLQLLSDGSSGKSSVVQELTYNIAYTFMGRLLTITKNFSVFPGSDMPTGEQTFTFSIKLNGEIPGIWGTDVLTKWNYSYLAEYEDTASITVDFDQYSSPEEIPPASVTVRVPAGMAIAGWGGTYTSVQQLEEGGPATEGLFFYDDPNQPAWAQFDWLIDEVEAPDGWNNCLPEGGDTLTMNAAPYIEPMILASTGNGDSSDTGLPVAAVPNTYSVVEDSDGNWVKGPTWEEAYAWEYEISLRNIYSENVVIPECSREVFEPSQPAPVSFDKAFVAGEGCALPDEPCTFTFELDGYRNRLETDKSLVDTFVHLTQTVEYTPGNTSATVTFADVPAGRYTLVEVDVPEGWTSDLNSTEGVLVYVATDGTVTFEEPGTPIEELGNGETSFTVTNTSSYVPPEEPPTPEEPPAPEKPSTPANPTSTPAPKREQVPATGDATPTSVVAAVALAGGALMAAGRRFRKQS